MGIKAGDRMPSGTLKVMTKDGPKDVSTDDLFKGKKVVLFSVPGAFTPTCDAKHLPGFVQLADQIRAKGVDTIACMAVNDVFVMNAWGKASSAGDKVMMLADGNGEYAKALGLELDAASRHGHARPAVRTGRGQWRPEERRRRGARPVQSFGSGARPGPTRLIAPGTGSVPRRRRWWRFTRNFLLPDPAD